MNQLKRVPVATNVVFGSFMVESGKVRVSDPCYCPSPREGRGVVEHGEGILLLNARNGRWQLMGNMVIDGMFGRRCLALMAFHESMFGYFDRGRKLGKLYVDSGQMSVFDDAHFPREEAQFEYNDNSSFYKRVCDLTFCEETGDPLFGGVLEHGGVTSSGYGDGSYPAYGCVDDSGLTVAITVDFGDEEDEEEYDDDDDDDDWDEEDDDDDDDGEDEPDEDDA